MRMTSVPANWPVATTRSPTSLFNTLIVPSIGAYRVVLLSWSRNWLSAPSVWRMFASEAA